MKEIIDKETVKKLPISVQVIEPVEKKNSIFIDRKVAVEKYQSNSCNVYNYSKPISKII